MPTRVLLLEGNSDLCTDYRDALEGEGFEVRDVGDADGAVAAIREGWPDVAVLNLAAPDIDGLDLLWDIAMLDRPVPLVISAVSATRTDEVLAWVAEGFMKRSPDFHELKQHIMTTLTTRSQPDSP